MPGFLGADFNASQPSDDALVKNGAAEFRNLKSRIKTFEGVLHNLETGELKDNIVGYAKLKDLSPDPSGEGNWVTVNEKGLVTAVEEVDNDVASIPKRYIYRFSSTYKGVDPDGTTIEGTLTTDPDGLTVRTYNFTVPAGVTRIMVQVQGAGGGGGYGGGEAGGGSGGAVEAILTVEPSDVFLVTVGKGGDGKVDGGAASQKGALTQFYFSPTHFIECAGGGAGGGSGGSGGTADVFGWTPLAQARLGSQGSSTVDTYVAAGGYFSWGDGGGGAAQTSGGFGSDGGDGRIIITYWTI